MRYSLTPAGWPCRLDMCPPGPFIYEGRLCLKSEYCSPERKFEAFGDTGEFIGSEMPQEARAALIVQPVFLEIQY